MLAFLFRHDARVHSDAASSLGISETAMVTDTSSHSRTRRVAWAPRTTKTTSERSSGGAATKPPALPKDDEEARVSLMLDHLGLLGRVLLVLGIFPWWKTGGPSGGWRWRLRRLPAVVYGLLVLVRMLRGFSCNSEEPDEALDNRVFPIIFVTYFACAGAVFCIAHGPRRMLARPIEISRAFQVSLSPAGQLIDRLEVHRQLLSDNARGLGAGTLAFTGLCVVLINGPRFARAVTATMDGTPVSYGYTCDTHASGLFAGAPMVFAVFVLASDTLMYLMCIAVFALATWLGWLHTHVLSEQHAVVDAMAAEVEELCEHIPTAPSARSAGCRFSSGPLESLQLARAMSIHQHCEVAEDEQPAPIDLESMPGCRPRAADILSDLRYEEAFLSMIGDMHFPLTRVIVMVCVVALAVTGTMVVPALVRLSKLEGMTLAALFAFFDFAIAFSATALMLALGSKVARHQRRLGNHVKELITSIKQINEAATGADDDRDTGSQAHTASSQTVQSTVAPQVRHIRHSLTTSRFVPVVSFWRRFVPVYARLFKYAAAVTLIVIIFVVVSGLTRNPDCVEIVAQRGSPIATYNTDKCSSEKAGMAYMAGVLLVGVGSIAAPALLLGMTQSFDIDKLRDIVPGSVIMVVVSTVIIAINGFTMQLGTLSRVPAFIAFLGMAGFTAYRLARPGPNVTREPLSVHSAWMWFFMIAFFAINIVLTSGLFVLQFVFAPEAPRFFLALLGFPLVSMFARHMLSYFCEELFERTHGQMRTVAIYTTGHMYLSLVGRLLVLALGVVEDQVIVAALWCLMEIGHRALGPLARPLFVHVFVSDGERRKQEFIRGEQQRMSVFVRTRIFGRMLSEVSSVFVGVAIVLLMRALVADPENPDTSVSRGVSTADLFLSLVVQIFFEFIADTISSAVEETVLERQVLSLWAQPQGILVAVVVFGLFVCIGGANEELLVLVGKFEKGG